MCARPPRWRKDAVEEDASCPHPVITASPHRRGQVGTSDTWCNWNITPTQVHRVRHFASLPLLVSTSVRPTRGAAYSFRSLALRVQGLLLHARTSRVHRTVQGRGGHVQVRVNKEK